MISLDTTSIETTWAASGFGYLLTAAKAWSGNGFANGKDVRNSSTITPDKARGKQGGKRASGEPETDGAKRVSKSADGGRKARGSQGGELGIDR